LSGFQETPSFVCRIYTRPSQIAPYGIWGGAVSR
jgi:hypothetical protein